MSVSAQIQITYIPLYQIEPSPLNPRKHFDTASLEELAASIAAEGVLQPILVREIDDTVDGPYQRYEIVAGERRYRASIIAGLASIPAIIRILTDEEALEIMITENLQRQDIHPMEEAAGFQQIIQYGHMDIRELAARVGKSPSFVAHRLKLCQLIQEIQEHFFRGLILVKDALTISQLAAADQHDFYEENLLGNNNEYELSDYDIRKYRNRLDTAPFDITDESLLKGKPSCTVCPYNSASSVLFADTTERAICNDSTCYRAKCDQAYKLHLEQAIADPGVVLITGQRYRGDQIDKSARELVATSDKVVLYGAYQEIPMPELPDREYFTGDNETPEQDQADYEAALRDYETDMAEMRRRARSGQVIRAFVLGGDDKGKYVYVELRQPLSSTTTASTDDIDHGDLTEDDITAQIERIRAEDEKVRRKLQNDRWDEVEKLCDPVSYVKAAANNKLSTEEVQALAHAIITAIDSAEHDTSFRELIFGDPEGQSIPEGYLRAPHLLADMLRFFIIAVLPPYSIYNLDQLHRATLVETCLAEHFEHSIDDIGIRHSGIAATHDAATAKRIKALESQLKALRSKSTRKGKGIKALISDTQES